MWAAFERAFSKLPERCRKKFLAETPEQRAKRKAELADGALPTPCEQRLANLLAKETREWPERLVTS
jgi:hypothetical protein